jgi:hypothetical protein
MSLGKIKPASRAWSFVELFVSMPLKLEKRSRVFPSEYLKTPSMLMGPSRHHHNSILLFLLRGGGGVRGDEGARVRYVLDLR